MRAAYEKAEPKIHACADEMTDRRVALMRDSALLDRLYERNEELYRELCSLIVVGEEAICQAPGGRAGCADRGPAGAPRAGYPCDATASTQLAAQIRLVQQSDEQTCARLQAALEVTIPLWKSQMAAALGLARATDSMRMQRQDFRPGAKGDPRRGQRACRAARRVCRCCGKERPGACSADGA